MNLHRWQHAYCHADKRYPCHSPKLNADSTSVSQAKSYKIPLQGKQTCQSFINSASFSYGTMFSEEGDSDMTCVVWHCQVKNALSQPCSFITWGLRLFVSGGPALTVGANYPTPSTSPPSDGLPCVIRHYITHTPP